MGDWKPSVVIGIDVGMTGTGLFPTRPSTETLGLWRIMNVSAVSYSIGPEWTEPMIVQRWPSRDLDHNDRLADKVPTRVAYNSHGDVVSWGFECEHADVDTVVHKEFHQYLDPSAIHSHRSRPSYEQAVKSYIDYMRCMHQYLESYFSTLIPEWVTKDVEFLFSIPTIWKDPRSANDLKKWLSLAGYVNTHNRRVEVSLTAAEAAAVYATKLPIQIGDAVMAVDAGGLTTDINIVDVIEHGDERTLVNALFKPEGFKIGSAFVTWKARDLIEQSLGSNDFIGHEGIHPSWAAPDVMGSGFSEDLNSDHTDLDVCFNIPQSAFRKAQRSQDTSAIPEYCRVYIHATKLKQVVDEQLHRLFDEIDQQNRNFVTDAPGRVLKYVVLSGGFGSSSYIYKQTKNKYKDLQILCNPKPLVAIAMGLVINRVQALRTGISLYKGEFSRVSYGVLYSAPFDHTRHDARDQYWAKFQLWAGQQIQWLIKEGERIPENGITWPLRRPMLEESKSHVFHVDFVFSESPASRLPHSAKSESVSKLCTAHLEKKDEPKTRFFPSRPFRQSDYTTAEFNLGLTINSATLALRLLSTDGTPYNGIKVGMEVVWNDVVPRGNEVADDQNTTISPVEAGKRGHAASEIAVRSENIPEANQETATWRGTSSRKDSQYVRERRPECQTTHIGQKALTVASQDSALQASEPTLTDEGADVTIFKPTPCVGLQDFYDQTLSRFISQLKFGGCQICLPDTARLSVEHSLSLLYVWGQDLDLSSLEKSPLSTAGLLESIAGMLVKIASAMESDLFSHQDEERVLSAEAFMSQYAERSAPFAEGSESSLSGEDGEESPLELPLVSAVHRNHQRSLQRLTGYSQSLMDLLPTLQHIREADDNQ